MEMNQIFVSRSVVASPATQIVLATMSDLARCTRDDPSRKRVQHPTRQIGTCVLWLWLKWVREKCFLIKKVSCC